MSLLFKILQLRLSPLELPFSYNFLEVHKFQIY